MDHDGGPGIPDPCTNEMWFPAQRPGIGSTLVRGPRADDPLVLLGTALRTATHELAEPADKQRTQRTIVAFLDRIAPIRLTLHVSARAEPASRLAVVLGYVYNAVAHLDAGDIDAARAAVVTAHSAMGSVVASEAD
ncbi:MAG TPA: hypothetical protein VGL80_05365 [Pseudonocardiaceae bacterium]